MSASELHDTRGDVEPTVHQRLGWLTAILTAAFSIRAFRLGWGLPDFVFNDTKIHFARSAVRAASEGHWVLDRFVHPPPFPYVVSLATWIWSAVTGTELHTTGPQAQNALATADFIGRCLTVVLATAFVGATYLLARRLIGTRGALWTAFFVALSPLQVLESHRVNVDAPMLLLAVLAGHQAVVAYQERRRGRLALAFTLAALAGGVKYTGLYAGTLPLWVALRWPGASAGQRLLRVVEGGLVSLATFAIALSPALLNRNALVRDVFDIFYLGIFEGAPGQDLIGLSWVYAPYLYVIFVGLPFVANWAVVAAAVPGLAVMAVHQRTALTLLAAAALPFFVIHGAVETAVARYYQPLLPYVAIAAGAFMQWLRQSLPRIYVVAAVAIGGYSLVLAGSQVNRIGGAPQRAIGDLVHKLALAKRETGITVRAADQPKLVIGYPYWAASIYDAILPHIASNRDRHLVFLPPKLRSSGAALEESQALIEDRRWVNQLGIDVFIVTSRWENLAARNAFTPREAQFYENLRSGRLGLREATHEETTYITRSWYEWADPTLDTIWTAGIGGYRLFLRDDLFPALRM